MTLPSGPAKAAEASADEEEAAAQTVPSGMIAHAADDERSGAASRSAERGQLAAPAIFEQRDGQREQERGLLSGDKGTKRERESRFSREKRRSF